jgi:hypothetical protein
MRLTLAMLGKRLAAKAQRRDAHQVGVGGDFGGGVPLQGVQGVRAAHADAVVAHANQPPAAHLRLDFEAHRARVERVLDEFLQRGCGAFHHLSCSDAVDQLLVQRANGTAFRACAHKQKCTMPADAKESFGQRCLELRCMERLQCFMAGYSLASSRWRMALA